MSRPAIGFDAITVALLGRSTPWGTFFAGVLFGAFRAGGVADAGPAPAPPIDIVLVVQSLDRAVHRGPAAGPGDLPTARQPRPAARQNPEQTATHRRCRMSTATATRTRTPSRRPARRRHHYRAPNWKTPVTLAVLCRPGTPGLRLGAPHNPSPSGVSTPNDALVFPIDRRVGRCHRLVSPPS